MSEPLGAQSTAWVCDKLHGVWLGCAVCKWREAQAEVERLRRVVEGVKAHREELRWVMQTVHQAHHDGAIEGCPSTVCARIRDLLVIARPGQ